MIGPCRVLLCCMDGVRPDGLQAADTPTVDRLLADGAYTWTATSVMPTVTLPCHQSMFRGVDVGRHGITTNRFQPLAEPVPSIIDAVHEAGGLTGSFYNWEQLRDLSEPGSLNVSYMTRACDRPEGDQQVAGLVIQHLPEWDFDFLFVYFGYPDEAGHRHGYMADEYLAAISNADACLGRIVQRLAELDRFDETVLLLTSDHGGHERSHGTDQDADMLIPWALHGPGVRPGHQIRGEVRLFDTCPTLAHLLGLDPSAEWDGRVIAEALADSGAKRKQGR